MPFLKLCYYCNDQDSLFGFNVAQRSIEPILNEWGERIGLVVRVSDSGSGDSSSILGRVSWVGVLFP